jgi:hypothetical protein
MLSHCFLTIIKTYLKDIILKKISNFDSQAVIRRVYISGMRLKEPAGD